MVYYFYMKRKYFSLYKNVKHLFSKEQISPTMCRVWEYVLENNCEFLHNERIDVQIKNLQRYITVLDNHTLGRAYFNFLILDLFTGLYLTELFEKSNRNLSRLLEDELPLNLEDETSIYLLFQRLYDVNSPVRIMNYYMDSLPQIREIYKF